MEVAQDMERDPEFLLDVDYFSFTDVSDVITDSCSRYRQTKVKDMMHCTHVCLTHVITVHMHVLHILEP